MTDVRVLIVTGDTPLSARQLPGGVPEVRHGTRCYTFDVNESQAPPDFVVVRNKHLRWPRRLPVPRGCTLLALSEPTEVCRYPGRYLRQFGRVWTTQPELGAGPRVMRMPPMLPWLVGVRDPQSQEGGHTYSQTHDSLLSARPKKTRLLSCICSTKVRTSGQRLRVEMLHQLSVDRPGLVDFYGRGTERWVADKWTALAPYHFTIVLENSSERDYFTEKLTDALLARCGTVYLGCPNVGEYFRSPLVVDGYASLLAAVDRVAASGAELYSSLAADIEGDARRALGEYNAFELVATALDGMELRAGKCWMWGKGV